MKTNSFLCLLSFMTSISVFASADPCATGSVFERLANRNTKRMMGNCHVEIHICEKRATTGALPYYLSEPLKDHGQYWVGDVYVKVKNGKSLYIPLFALESKFPNTSVQVDDHSNFIRYRYEDRIYDPVTGKKEKYEIKFFKRRQKIEVSMSSSRESRRNPIRSLFFPDIQINCEQ